MKSLIIAVTACAALTACVAPPPPVPADWAHISAANSPEAIEAHRRGYAARLQAEHEVEQRKRADAQEQARIKALQDYVNHRREVEQRNTPRGRAVAGSAKVKGPTPVDLDQLKGSTE